MLKIHEMCAGSVEAQDLSTIQRLVFIKSAIHESISGFPTPCIIWKLLKKSYFQPVALYKEDHIFFKEIVKQEEENNNEKENMTDKKNFAENVYQQMV